MVIVLMLVGSLGCGKETEVTVGPNEPTPSLNENRPTPELPKPLPDDVVKAWKDAGATLGWMKGNEYGYLVWHDKPEAGAVPAFRFGEWKDGVVAKLPAPKAPFGIALVATEATDSGLKEIAKLKKLTTLYLGGKQVTDTGVAELKKALPKCKINR